MKGQALMHFHTVRPYKLDGAHPGLSIPSRLQGASRGSLGNLFWSAGLKAENWLEDDRKLQCLYAFKVCCGMCWKSLHTKHGVNTSHNAEEIEMGGSQ